MDWNNNGKKDSFDSFMDYKLITGQNEELPQQTGCCLFSLALILLPATAAVTGIILFVQSVTVV